MKALLRMIATVVSGRHHVFLQWRAIGHKKSSAAQMRISPLKFFLLQHTPRPGAGRSQRLFKTPAYGQ